MNSSSSRRMLRGSCAGFTTIASASDQRMFCTRSSMTGVVLPVRRSSNLVPGGAQRANENKPTSIARAAPDDFKLYRAPKTKGSAAKDVAAGRRMVHARSHQTPPEYGSRHCLATVLMGNLHFWLHPTAGIQRGDPMHHTLADLGAHSSWTSAALTIVQAGLILEDAG